jgi:hypothetical protein
VICLNHHQPYQKELRNLEFLIKSYSGYPSRASTSK